MMSEKKSKTITVLLVAASWLIATSSSWADVRLPRLVSDHMVLQRDSTIIVWGWAAPGEQVRITFHGQSVSARAHRSSRWSMILGPFAAGGPYDMVIAGKNKVTVHDILLGDVWLASGQSNMEFTLGHGPDDYMVGVVNADQEIADTGYPQLRQFKVHHKVGFKPVDDVEADTWTASTPQSAANFSAVAFLFDREIHRRYHIPVGLIETSWGGTVAEAWVSTAGLKSLPEFGNDIREVEQANDASVTAEHDRYTKLKAEWDKRHSGEDRGERGGSPLWADPALDVSAWPTITEPQSKPNERLRGFDGVVRFRREITIPADMTSQHIRVHLSTVGKTDTTYFNGKEIGHTEGWDKARSYVVPAEAIKAGRNVIAVRMTGESGYVGMFDADNPEKLYVEVGRTDLPYQDLGLISPDRIKGAIWYQGESNALDNRSAQYRTHFPVLIRDWRNQWGYEFPFLFVQLAGFGHNKPSPAEYPWAELYEAQSMTLSVPGTGMATAVDIGDENDIHPRNKHDVAHRLVLAAAKVAYGEDIVYSGPTYRSMQVEGNRVRIKFSNLGSGLVVKDKYGYARGFEVAGADRKFQWAQARQDGEDIVVSNGTIQQPIAVRYDWMNTPDGNVYNVEGLPAIPFRTDAPTSLMGAR